MTYSLKYNTLSLVVLLLPLLAQNFLGAISQDSKRNQPWYPSIDAFEHYNSGRTHLFAQAMFGGFNSFS